MDESISVSVYKYIRYFQYNIRNKGGLRYLDLATRSLRENRKGTLSPPGICKGVGDGVNGEIISQMNFINRPHSEK